MTVIDLFCGVGGFSLGFKQAGLTVSLAVDNWKQVLDSHRANHPETKHLLKDIKEVKSKDLEKHNAKIILGSPPCQQFSVANNNPDVKKGLELTNYFLDLIESLNPDYWIMENVPGVAKYIRGRIFQLGGRIHVLNAADYGVPQIRKRVFCGRFPFPPPTHAEKPQRTLVGNLKKWLTVADVLTDVQLPEDENLEPTEKSLERALAILRKDKVPYFTEIISGSKQCHTLLAHTGKDFSSGGLIDTCFFDRHGKNFYSDGRPAPALTTKTLNLHVLKERIRRISSVEAKILMGFPSNYIVLSSAISTRFKQIGNAVCPPVAKAIAATIKEVSS